jgi:hypothetical protein
MMRPEPKLCLLHAVHYETQTIHSVKYVTSPSETEDLVSCLSLLIPAIEQAGLPPNECMYEVHCLRRVPQELRGVFSEEFALTYSEAVQIMAGIVQPPSIYEERVPDA